MAELTNLESKLGEVLGLAQAAQKTTKKVASLVDDDNVKSSLQQMHEEAAETERRATEIAGGHPSPHERLGHDYWKKTPLRSRPTAADPAPPSAAVGLRCPSGSDV